MHCTIIKFLLITRASESANGVLFYESTKILRMTVVSKSHGGPKKFQGQGPDFGITTSAPRCSMSSGFRTPGGI